MIGCSFVVDREYFGEIGLLDPGMEVYGGENIELGMRVSTIIVEVCSWNIFEHRMVRLVCFALLRRSRSSGLV